MKRFTVTIGQLVLTDPQDVFEQIKKTLNENPETDLFIFPEFSTQERIDLPRIEYLREKPASIEAVRNWLDLVPELNKVKSLVDRHGKAAIIGCISQNEANLFSRAYLYDSHNQQQAFYDKSHVHWTEDFLIPGDLIEPIHTRFGKIGILICYDLAFLEPTRVLGLKGAEMLVALSAIPLHFHWKYAHYRMTGAAIFNQYYVAAAHLGYSLNAPMGGYSGIYSPEGDLIQQIKHTDFGHITAQIDLSQVKNWREMEVINPHRRPKLYGVITESDPGEAAK